MSAAHKTSTQLADGRELIYFDARADLGPSRQAAVDRRELPPRVSGSELRFDPVLSEWVAVASHRQTRTFLPPADQCPLCPTRHGQLTEIPADDYGVVVFENRFPSLATDATLPVDADPAGWPRRAGVGRCEVVCFSPDHGGAFGSLRPDEAELVMAAWADRTTELARLSEVQQVFCFENRGQEMGVTLDHPHGQIYAYPFVPPRIERMVRSAEAYVERTGRNLFDDVVAAEIADGSRVVAESEHWVGFVPEAAHWPVELHIYPSRRVPDLAALTDRERADFAGLYLRLLHALDAYYGVPLPYVSGWYQAPVHQARDLVALHLELFSVRRAPDKLKYVAGSESAMGVWINDMRPEAIAERIRELM